MLLTDYINPLFDVEALSVKSTWPKISCVCLREIAIMIVRRDRYMSNLLPSR